MAVTYIRSDLEFILQQILISEQHAAGADLTTLVPNAFVPFGLRTVDGSLNNLFPGNENFGAADQLFPRLLDPAFIDEGDEDPFPLGPPPAPVVTNTDYGAPGSVVDSDPRIISNLIVDQTSNNPAAVAVAGDIGADLIWGTADDVLNDGVSIVRVTAGLDGIAGNEDDIAQFSFDNVAPDEGLSAPFNLWFVFFGQFFDHGLDLVQKGGNETIFIPLQPDDPLITLGPDGAAGTGDEAQPGQQFMVLTRATNFGGEHLNQTSPFVDQNQTYTSHASHQVFLREYQLDADGDPVVTGRLITNRDLVDGEFGNGDDVELGGMSTWAVVKAQARDLLGIALTDEDVGNVPLLATDAYGNFLRGPNGFPQVTVLNGDGEIVLIEGDPAAPIDLANPIPGDPDAVVVRTGHAFLLDIAHSANPFDSQTNELLTPDADDAIGDDGDPTTYDDELLDEHFMAGDGRVNENIGLTTVHHVFHSEHNRLVEHTKQVALDTGDLAFLNQWLATPLAEGTPFPTTQAEIDALVWNGERLFQAAKFGTEMQYQHLVFEEFARKVQPNVDEFLAPEGFATQIDPAILAEFAHVVYRFGHSMLLDTVDRLDPNFASTELGLIEAFLNPLGFNEGGTLTPEQAAGAIVRGTTRQVGNEIDEFKTEALRNNLLGLPLDLAAINLARGRDTGVPSLNAARREFYDATGDSQLTPYESWIDFMQGIQHPESLVNFIAAYGTHDAINLATTLADKRAAADLLVFGDGDDSDGVTIGGVIYADRLDFLNGTGAWANAGGITTTGVDNIDFWIGGLAERIMPFGGFLGSTFNFVFETQLEVLQNGDRFYYLARLAGLNFLTELENNSFAKMIMANTDATHLPGDVFSTPSFILEVDQSRQFTGLGLEGRDDPTHEDTTGLNALNPLVIRDNPVDTDNPATLFNEATANYLEFTGGDHVVLGGTDSDDILIASIGDDTLWGDGGNDRLEGGDGNDMILGGAGHDIITDRGGDDNLQGEDGNDVIQGGNGFNLLLGGAGNDFIITGEDVSETFGGRGNDFILGSQMNLPTFGNEGDDWIEIGTSDGAGGDNFDPQEGSPVVGHDVFITGGGFDEVDGEGGDDIMVGSDGEDHFSGGGGFDWASYEHDRLGVTVDLNVNDLIEPPVTPSASGILDRFDQVEGLSGSALSDILRGDDADAAEIDVNGAQNSALTAEGIARIAGLQDLLGAGVTRFATGNIILGGDGSDIIEGRGGDDLIDGDRSLNVRVSVREGFDPVTGQPTGGQIATFESIADPVLLQNMLNGVWNPGQLLIVREILPGDGGFNFDTAAFSGNRDQYDVIVSDGVVTVVDNVAGRDGVDRLTGIERLQFADTAEVLVEGLNEAPVGVPTISDPTPAEGQQLTVSIDGVTDADNPGTGAIDGAHFVWQVERDPVGAPNVFEDIVDEASGNPATATGSTFTVPADLDGLRLRVKVIYQDANGVLETVFSAATQPVTPGTPPAPAAVLPDGSNVESDGIHLITADLQFILEQIKIAEQAPDGNVLDLIANPRLPFGLRTVDGSFNNLVRDQENFGAADQNFPLLLEQVFRNEQDEAPFVGITNTNYAATGPGGNVVDRDPRIISNLIVDQSINNPAAVAAALRNAGSENITGDTTAFLEALQDVEDGVPGAQAAFDALVEQLGLTIVASPGRDGQFGTADDRPVFEMPNITPDEGLSAPFNAWFVFFGQFFDHGLDLVDKGGNGAVFMPLLADDPLVAGADGIFGNEDDLPASQRFMILSRATNTAVQAGADGTLGTSDDVHFHNNETTPFVDQNQTYTSDPSHQVFLREYEADANGRTVATGRLLDGAGGIGNWAEVKAQALEFLGIILTDLDIFDVPMLATDAYGRFIPGTNGFAQVVTNMGLIEGTAAGLDLDNLPGGAIAGRTGHAFLNDIAHFAVPFGDHDGNPATPDQALTPDADSVAGGPPPTLGSYDDELLDAHFVTGDGRGNENIGLTAVHHVFHSEHNRLVDHIKDVVLASAAATPSDLDGDVSFLNEWLLAPVTEVPADLSTLVWNGERLFQAARFGTEMQYQHLVFEEFARKVQPQVDVFLAEGQGYDTTIDAAIVAEFAHTVYRFGHSMLLETVDRFDPAFQQDTSLGLIAAFLNPLEFTNSGDPNTPLTAEQAAGAIVRGTTRQTGNEIDEFVTDALRNNLLGLPLDLPSINIARGRDTGVPSLNAARATFYEWTGDSQLKPYASWIDFMQNLKNPESLVNFIAAYGTHSSITSQTTLEGKRAAAFAIVMGVPVTLSNGTVITPPSDRLAFLNGPAATTGVNDIDLWIGGLAEKIMPFGGMLGSTFNYVFENQMEKLQNGDRFYYLERTAALNFLTELENNSFAKLIMANTDATHLPGDVFSTPAFILEVDQTRQFHEDLAVLPGQDGILLDDPTTPQDESADNVGVDPVDDSNPLNPLVIRDNPTVVDDLTTPFFNEAGTNYLEYTGGDHVVLGGTDGDDILIGSIGDDTLYGDGGHDRLEGGDGVDMILGGDGDDIITDMSLEDNLQGGDGNDAINAGNSIDLILGGFGNDFIVTGEDGDETFGGPGNDFILGDPADEMVFGNEGDDWIEGGMADGSAGENFDTRGLDLIVGNDVFIDSMFPDRMNGEGGDDIMVGSMGGQVDRFIGGSGFDWASFQGDELAADVDLSLRAFDETPVPLSIASALSRFESAEGLSGSGRSDILRGDDEDATTIPNSGAQGSTLTNFALIDGLQDLVDGLLGPGQTSFSAGNIILGGAGSDIIEGRGGDDLIDGDRSLNVRISVRAALGRDAEGNLILGDEIESVTSMTELVDRVFSGEINPGQLQIVREILPDNTTTDFDTAVFSGAIIGAGEDDVLGTDDDVQQFTFEVNGAATTLAALIADGIDDGDVLTVTNLVDDDGDGVAETPGPEGTDTLRHIERLQFADETIVLRQGLNEEPDGLLVILGADGNPIGGATPVEGQVLRVSINEDTGAIVGVTDADNTDSGGAIIGPVAYVWQFEPRAGTGVFEDIVIATGLGDLRATGPTLTVPPDVAGSAIRVKAVYEDEHGVLETVFSAPTAPVQGINDAATGVPTISDTTPIEGLALTAITSTIVDPDGTDDAVVGGLFTFRWQQFDGTNWVNATNPDAPLGPDDGTGQLFTPGQNQVGLMLRVRVTFLDDGGNPEEVFSTPTQAVVDDTLTGTDGDDVLTDGPGFNQTILGLAGNDVISGLDGVDIIFGGLGDDTIDGGTGDDQISGDEGSDTINGGAGNDFIDGDLPFTDAGDDFIDGGTGADIMQAGDGSDTFVVDDLGDTVFDFGLEGIDTIRTTLGAFALDSVTGVENLTYTGTGSFAGTGTELDNVITGGAGNDTLDGLGGNDTLNGGAGADAMTGGAGNDTYVVDNAGDQVIEVNVGTPVSNTTLAAAAPAGATNIKVASVTGMAAGDTITVDSETRTIASVGTAGAIGTGVTLTSALALAHASGAPVQDLGTGVSDSGGIDTVLTALSDYTLGANVENLTYIGAGNFTGTGNALANVITGNGGNDWLDGRAGADIMTGGAGGDVYVVDNAGDQVVEGAGGGTDTVLSMLNAYLLGPNAENLTFIGTGDFMGTGNALDNVIVGGAGVDWLDGREGNDWLEGAAGNDTLMGAGGNDTLVGAAGVDWLDGGDAADWLDGGADNDTLVGAGGNDVLVGAGGNDWLDGGDGLDWLDGGDASDTLVGAGDNDTLVGAGGDDWLDGGAGADWLDGGADNDTLVGDIGNDVLVGAGGNDWLDGGDGLDWLDGGDGNDVLLGVAGADVLVGGAGADFLDGGAGDDILVFAPGFGNDVAVGFDADPAGGQDVLFLSGFGITAANFAANVSITDLGNDTLVTIGADSIFLVGVNGVGANTITQQDFILA